MLSALMASSPTDGSLSVPRPCQITQYDRSDESRALARRSEFVCEYCRVKMIPAFPNREKVGRRKSPCAYFRADPRHLDGFACTKPVAPSTGAQSRSVTEGRPSRRSAPSRFVDRVDSRGGQRSDPWTEQTSNDEGSTNRSSRVTVAGDRTSNSTVTSIRDLVVPWHLDPQSLQRSPLTIARCPGRTYSSSLVEVNAAAAARMPSENFRFVYWASADQVIVHPSGYELRFSVQAPDNRWLRAFIRRGLEPDPTMKTIRDRLDAAAQGVPTTIYILGTFRGQPGRKSLTIEPDTARYVWAEPGMPGA